MYKALIVDERGSNVLVERCAASISFPSVASPEVPHFGQRMSECVASTLKVLCDTDYDLVLLYSTLNETYQDDLRLPHRVVFSVRGPVAETGEPAMPVCERYDWALISEICSGEETLLEDDDNLALVTLLRDAANPWERPMWFSNTVEEAAKVMRSLALETRSVFTQHTVTDHSTILSIETSNEVVYLKLSNDVEMRVTGFAASLAPSLVRQLLHVPVEHGWLMMYH